MLKIITLPGGLSALLINLYEDRRQTYGLRPKRQYGVGQIRKCLKPASRAILAAQLDCTCIATSQWRELSQRWQDARSALLSVIGLLYNGTGWPSSKKATSELSQIILIQTCPLREKGTTFQISFECGRRAEFAAWQRQRKVVKTTLSRMNFSGYVGHVTLFSWMRATALCLVVG